MRSIWSGSISFGLVNIPVTLHPATQTKQLNFHLLNKRDSHPVKYLKVDEEDDTVLTKDDIVKGFEFEKGRYIVLEDKDFEDAEIKTGRTIDISDFVSIGRIDPIYFQKSYYLFPEESSRKAYKILEKSLQKTKNAAIAKVVIRNKQHLVVIRPKNDCLVMETMFYQDEIRMPVEIKEMLNGIEISKSEEKMANDLIAAMETDFQPEKYSDEYRQNLLDIIKKKIDGQVIVTPKVHEKEAVADIMEALKESIAQIEKQKKEAERKSA